MAPYPTLRYFIKNNISSNSGGKVMLHTYLSETIFFLELIKLHLLDFSM